MVTKHQKIRCSYELEQSLKAMKLLGHDVMQIVAIEVDGGPNARAPTRTFDMEDPELITWVKEHNQLHNLYFTLNEAKWSPSKKPAESAITRIHGIGFDCDPIKGATLDEEKLRLRHLGRDMLLRAEYPPTYVIMTGNGIQGVFLFKQPLDEFDPKQIKSLGKQLQKAMHADKTANLDRLYRLPGTVNHPTQSKRERGYVETQSGLMLSPKGQKARKYTLAEL